jgi:hypothetical protein
MRMTNEDSFSKNEQAVLDRLASLERISKEYLCDIAQRATLNVRAAIYDLVMDSSRSRNIDPTPEWNDYIYFCLPYLELCIVENPDVSDEDPETMVHSRWAACHELASFFRWLWNNSGPPSALAGLKEQIGKLYIDGDTKRRRALVQGTLEHLFENASVREFFADWATSESPLRNAYAEAMEWSREGGRSPLWK